MRTVTILGMLVLAALTTIGEAKSAKVTTSSSKATVKVAVYYFHFTRRCNTCKTVEANAQKAVAALNAGSKKGSNLTFESLNIEEPKGKALAAKIGVDGQALVVVNGTKKADITDKAFLYSDQADKIREEIRKSADKVLQ